MDSPRSSGTGRRGQDGSTARFLRPTAVRNQTVDADTSSAQDAGTSSARDVGTSSARDTLVQQLRGIQEEDQARQAQQLCSCYCMQVMRGAFRGITEIFRRRGMQESDVAPITTSTGDEDSATTTTPVDPHRQVASTPIREGEGQSPRGAPPMSRRGSGSSVSESVYYLRQSVVSPRGLSPLTPIDAEAYDLARDQSSGSGELHRHQETIHDGDEFDVIILGVETSALVWYKTKGLEQLTGMESPKALFIGQRESWSHMEPDLSMGQVKHLLSLPGQKVPEYSTEFMKAQDYAANIREARTGMLISDSLVSSINKDPGDEKYRIHMRDMTLLSADKVIIATGSGPIRRPNISFSSDVPVEPTPYQKVMSGVDYLKSGQILTTSDDSEFDTSKLKLAIEGGSATAAWVYEKALANGYKPENIYWFTRSSNWDKAFPPGERNQDIQRQSEGSRVAGISPRDVILQGKKVHLSFKDKSRDRVVDQYIFAIGTDINGSYGLNRILSEDIRNRLEDVYDTNGYFYDGEDDAVIGLASQDKSLYVIGSAVHSMLKDKNENEVKRAKYDDTNKTLPANARPPEGIPTIISTIAALNHYMPVYTKDMEDMEDMEDTEKIDINSNFNLDNRTQLAAYIANKYPDLPASDANTFVERILKIRTRSTTPYGMNQEAIGRIEQSMESANRREEEEEDD